MIISKALGVRGYPSGIQSLTLTKGKICMSFDKPQLKANGTTKDLPISPKGTDLEHLAVGVSTELHKELAFQLIRSYRVYAEHFDPSFKQFLESLKDFLEEEIENISEKPLPPSGVIKIKGV